MPNTLVHLGVQGLGSRLISSRIDLKWVFLGCIIPDLPWIFRRAVISLAPDINVYDLWLYTVVQASLLFCILLSLAFALMSAKPRPVFGILALNSLVHLLLDALEIKWGNGVHLFAPFTWEFLNFGLLWPDSWPIAVLSLSGIIVGVWALVYPAPAPVRIYLHPGWRLIAVAILLCVYAFAPLTLLNGPYSANIQSIATLQEPEHRIGKEIHMDREKYRQEVDGDVVITFAGEPLRVIGDLRADSSQVSLIGEFVESDAIRILRLHEYRSPWRDLASYIGLGIVFLIWTVALIREQ